MNLVIRGKLPSANEYIAADKRHRYAGGKVKREATELVAWQCKGKPKIKKPADYTFTWYVSNMRTDPDNISFAQKFIFDGLQVAGLLPNDSMRWVRSITHFFEIGEPRVVVQIDEE